MRARSKLGAFFRAFLGKQRQCQEGIHLRGRWAVECRRSDGTLRWRETIENLVVNQGLDEILNATLAAQTQHTAWFVGLLASSPSPLPGWTKTEVGAADFVNYDEATLPAWTPNGASSGQSVSNSASKAVFTISVDSSTIGGAYLASTNTKAVESGSAIIYAAGAFTGGDKNADDNDTLSVTATFTAADDGV